MATREIAQNRLFAEQFMMKPTVSVCALCTLLLLTPLLQACRATVLAAAILPHGDIALDPDRDQGLNATQRSRARELQAAAHQAGHRLAAARPELVLLTSPHGIADMDRYAFFINPTAAGCLDPAASCSHGRCSTQCSTRCGLPSHAGGAPDLPGAGPCTCANVSVDAGTSVALLKYLKDRWGG